MYIRWKIKPRRNAYEPNGKGWNSRTNPVNLYIAYLVESRRIDGKPRQKTTYLASIKDKDLHSAGFRRRFWRTVQEKLQPFNLSSAQLLAIQAKLLERVPEATEEDLRVEDEEFKQAMSRLSARL